MMIFRLTRKRIPYWITGKNVIYIDKKTLMVQNL